jgi:hypothetical protein
MPKPIAGTYPVYFDTYISEVAEDDAILALKNQQPIVNDFFLSIPSGKTGYAYAEGKWTLKELLQHLIDGERIFAYRALSFARQETQSLPGFEENSYASVSNANAREWSSLCEEFKLVRASSICLFESFTDQMLEQAGLANDNLTSVNSIGFIMAGHLYHHKRIIEERYL